MTFRRLLDTGLSRLLSITDSFSIEKVKDMAAAASTSLCEISRYDCDKNEGIIKELGDTAEGQRAGFKRIFPWEKQCDKGDFERKHIHYVAHAHTKEGETIICGWLTAIWKTEFDQNYVYINEISTRRIVDAYYGGVGQRLHARLVEDAKASGAEFIYLFPLDDGVVPIYEKWGYRTMRPEISHMFLKLRNEPGRKILDSLMPENPRLLLYFAHELAARRPEDKPLLALIAKTRRTIIERPEIMRQLVEVIQTIEGTEYMEEDAGTPEEERMPLEEKRAMIAEVFQSVVKRGGSCKSRKQVHKKMSSTNTRKLKKRG